MKKLISVTLFIPLKLISCFFKFPKTGILSLVSCALYTGYAIDGASDLMIGVAWIVAAIAVVANACFAIITGKSHKSYFRSLEFDDHLIENRSTVIDWRSTNLEPLFISDDPISSGLTNTDGTINEHGYIE